MTDLDLNPNQAEFSAKLRHYIENRGYRRTRIVRELGYKDRSILNKWLSGISKMPFEALIKFCEICQLNNAQSIELVKLAGYEEEIEFIKRRLQEDKI